MKSSRQTGWVRTILGSAITTALGIAVAQAGIFGALNDLASAAQDSGVHVPSPVYEAGDAAQNLRDAGQQVIPSTNTAPSSTCPPGYTCTPQTPPPACPPGDICRPVTQTAQAGLTSISEQNAELQSSLGFSILPRERRHQGDPHYIQFVLPTQAFENAHDPEINTMGNPGHYRRFEVSQNNRQLPYLSPTDWQQYIVETFRLWPREQEIPTSSVIPGDTHGGLYRIHASDYRFFTHTAVSFFLGNAEGEAKIAEERARGVHVPNLWVILDPDCTLSYDFFQQAKAYANAGTIDVHAVVVGLDAGSPGRAEAILSSRVPGTHGAGVGEMARMELAQNYDHFSFSPEQGGIQPMEGSAAVRHLVRVNDRLSYAADATYSRQDNDATELMAYPTMLFQYHGTSYLYTNIHSNPILYTQLLKMLTA